VAFWRLEAGDSDRLAVVDAASNTEWSWTELRATADDFASLLPDDPKPVGLVFCDRSAAQIAAYLGALRSGAAVVLLDARLAERQRNRLLERYRPRFVWHPEPDAVDREAWRRRDLGTDGYLWLRTEPAPGPIHPDFAVGLSTSGTTGSPKLVRLSYENLAANAAAITDYLELDERSRAITSLPTHYAYGLSILNSRLHAGGSLVCTDASPTTAAFWEAFEGRHCTSVAGVPFTWRLFRRLEFGRRDLEDLRVMTQAGGALARPLVEHFHRVALDHDAAFYVMYGQTEATARMAYVPPAAMPEKAHTIGVPIPGGEFSLESRPETADADGELVYTGPNVMMGYAESRPELAEGDRRDGRLATGDLARRDDDGFYELVGRIDRFSKLYGRRLHTDHLATRIRNEFDTEVACLVLEDTLHAVIGDRAAPTDEIRGYLIDCISLPAKALEVHSVDQLPHTTVGKIDFGAIERNLTDA